MPRRAARCTQTPGRRAPGPAARRNEPASLPSVRRLRVSYVTPLGRSVPVEEPGGRSRDFPLRVSDGVDGELPAGATLSDAAKQRKRRDRRTRPSTCRLYTGIYAWQRCCAFAARWARGRCRGCGSGRPGGEAATPVAWLARGLSGRACACRRRGPVVAGRARLERSGEFAHRTQRAARGARSGGHAFGGDARDGGAWRPGPGCRPARFLGADRRGSARGRSRALPRRGAGGARRGVGVGAALATRRRASRSIRPNRARSSESSRLADDTDTSDDLDVAADVATTRGRGIRGLGR